MDKRQILILIKGEDKTNEIASYEYSNRRYCIRFNGSGKQYNYSSDNVKIIKSRKIISSSEATPVADGKTLTNTEEIIDFGKYYRIIFKDNHDKLYKKHRIRLIGNCLSNADTRSLFEYFAETASLVSLKSGDRNLLKDQYDHIEKISDETVLAKYLDKNSKPGQLKSPETLIYPFGLNQSQKTAVENAFKSQISIIQGPPGTGKTQTILNIISNAVRLGKTVAVASSNNSATENIIRKLEKKDLSFIAAFLGSSSNRTEFISNQTGKYPDMSSWYVKNESADIPDSSHVKNPDHNNNPALSAKVASLSSEVNRMLDLKNRISEIDQELLELKPEYHYFTEYYKSSHSKNASDPSGILSPYSKALENSASEKIMSILTEYEDIHAADAAQDKSFPDKKRKHIGFLKSLSLIFRYGIHLFRIFRLEPDIVIPYLQDLFYRAKKSELENERISVLKKLEGYEFDRKIKLLESQSLRLFKHELCIRYGAAADTERHKFTLSDLRRSPDSFAKEYPLILSTTYSLRKSLSPDFIYDYLIIDEASQVDLATGVLAMSCARNIVIVGDTKQLTNVLPEYEKEQTALLFDRDKFGDAYNYAEENLLSSALSVWPDAPEVLLREHYRCHPEIINFCNQKFYGGQLKVMTEDHGESDVLTLFITAPGNHARGHINQRQIDVIHDEIIPRLIDHEIPDIGIISPYRDQVNSISHQISRDYPDAGFEIDTVHKFQGREKDAIVISTVDNEISDFTDDPQMLNVAVSRAVKSLTVIMSDSPENSRGNYGDLAGYIKYQNCEIINSRIYSVFDLLYRARAKEREAYLRKHGRVSDYDSENLLYPVITSILENPEFMQLRCAVHVSLVHIIKDFNILTRDEQIYASNPLTHVDFLIFRAIDKAPVLAVEVDGTSFHREGSAQTKRDIIKNGIFRKCKIPMLRIRTDESGEKEKVSDALKNALKLHQTV